LVTGVSAGTTTITYTDTNGCQQTAVVTVSPAPSPSIAGSNQTVCSSAILAATAPVVGTGSWSVFSGPSLSTTQFSTTSNPSATFNPAGGGAGVYVLTWTTTLGACTSSSNVTITVNPSPTVVITDPAAVCAPVTVDLTQASITIGSTLGLTYTYWTDAAASSTLVNPNSVGISGTYFIKGTTGSCFAIKPVVVTINPIATASVTISANPGIAICSNTSVTFTASPTNGGPSPLYQWKKNGTPVGSNSSTATYTDLALVNDDIITVTMTSNLLCVTTPVVTSPALTIKVGALTSSVSITADTGLAICTGTNVTFTATPVNGGTTPTYQWKKNNIVISGATNVTYSDASLNDQDKISVDMKSNLACVSVQNVSSSALTMSVGNLTASVTIAGNPAGAICAGTSVTFTATPVNGGVNPDYQWNKNGTPITGATASTYADATLINNDNITVIMKSELSCVTPATVSVTSSPIAITIASSLPASVSIAANLGTTICTGASVTFTATPTNGGAIPQYQWKKNGNPISGATSSTYVDPGLANSDVIVVSMTSGFSCATPVPAVSNSLTITVDPSCSGIKGSCATVVVTPVPSPASCTVSNGGVNFNISPAVPAVNNIGVIIDLTGTSPTNITIARTQKNSFNFTALPSGVYDFKIQYGDAACTLTGKVTVDQSGTVGTPSASNIVSPKCFGQASGAVTISVPGETGNVLQWSLDGGIKDPFKAFTAGSQITGLPAGAAPNFQQVISVRRNSSDPCFAAVTITIPPGAADILAPTTVTNATCSNNDGRILVGTISGGTTPYAFKFDGVSIASLPANNTFVGLASGKHTLTITDANSCSKDFESNITFPGLVDFSVIGTSSSCVATANGSVTAIVSSVGSFKIGISTSQSVKPTTMFDVTSGGSTSYVFDKLPPASYFVFLNSVGSQCQNIKQQDISSAVQDITISYTTGAACSGANGSIVIKSVGGGASSSYTYALDGVSFTNLPANNTFTGLADGGHIFQVVDAGGCTKEFAIQIPVPTSVDFTLKNNPLKCIEEKATVTLSNFKGASVDYTYQILQQTNVVSSGLISSVNAKQDFVIKDLTLAQGNYQLQLQQNQASINGCSNPILAVKPFTITGPSKKLDTLYVIKNISLPDFATGSVAVGVTESGQDPYEVRVDLSKPLYSNQGYFQDWTKAIRNSENLKLEVQAKNLFAGEYLLSVRDGFGCVKDFTFNIKADESIFIPNVITPNGDDFNDTFFIRNLPSSTQVIIVNRWGKEVYKSDDYKNNWDAKDVTEGVYYYRIKAGEEVFTGWLEVLRDNK
jgi:gliding motility-associated-like protein